MRNVGAKPNRVSIEGQENTFFRKLGQPGNGRFFGSSRIYERARNLLGFNTFRQTDDEPRSPRRRVGLSPSP
jgi:hypothetical protein